MHSKQRWFNIAVVISSIVVLRFVVAVPRLAYADGSTIAAAPPSWVTDGNSYVQLTGSNVQMSFNQPTDGSLSSDEIAVIQTATQQYNNDPLVNAGITALLYTDQGQGLTLVPTSVGGSGDFYISPPSPVDPNQDPILTCIEGATILQVYWWGVSLQMPECLTQDFISADQQASKSTQWLNIGCGIIGADTVIGEGSSIVAIPAIPPSALVAAGCGAIMLAFSQGLGSGANTLSQVDASCGNVGVSVNVPWPVAGIPVSMWVASDSASCHQPTPLLATPPVDSAPTPSLVAPPVNPAPPPGDNNPTCIFGICF